MPQPDPLEFDFTEAEIYAALRLVAPDEEARLQAAGFARAYRPGMSWAMDDEGLLQLLAIGSESGAARVRRIRNALREARYDHWLSEQRARDHAASSVDLAHRWRDLGAEEEEGWQTRLAARRRALGSRGNLPPDSAGP